MNIVSKFHDNATINEFNIIILLRQFWVCEKKEGFDPFRRGKRENEFKRRV